MWKTFRPYRRPEGPGVQGEDQAKVLGGAGGWGPLLVSCEGQTTLRDIGITMISLSLGQAIL